MGRLARRVAKGGVEAPDLLLGVAAGGGQQADPWVRAAGSQARTGPGGVTRRADEAASAHGHYAAAVGGSHTIEAQAATTKAVPRAQP